MNAKRIGQGLAMGFFAVVLLGTVGCGDGGVDTVEAGTYEGTIDKVVLDEKEIYVTLDNGKRLELSNRFSVNDDINVILELPYNAIRTRFSRRKF